jgi:tRNA uridine 5-carbamoylmethylation protein Kti12
MILICGLPNAGKTTYSQKYENVIHFDEVKGGRHRRDNVIAMVSADNDVTVEGVYDKAKDRRRLVEASQKENTCIWLNTPVDECIRRESRQRGEHIIRWCSESFEPPTPDEGWDEIIIL